ncbi:TetR/AcrR family transcriptional regulator [Mycobacterium manitobense]|uniref:TetR/AcrR family transcriptional regulator n=1 Tax=[Mycobacterium] manitobense TaxID=190147 RepID=A0A9X3BXQ4_9MYCO|nr:TetR/AcrR family transcriptional regulator [[Mycobacterium] manitobense]MCV7173733.1 TetR/AcrR family transcriptional regulator [[Mycobacterium] manitobense]
MTTAATARVSRGRRPIRRSGDEREQAILTTAERLLDERGFAAISVDELARGAGISRPTFYFYFPSKDAVLRTLWAQVIREVDTALEVLADTADGREVWRPGIKVFIDTFGAHRGVTMAAFSSDNPEVRQMFSTFMSKWIDVTATAIEAERKCGAAPVTLPAHDIATALNLMNERTLLAAFTGGSPAVATDQVLQTLVHMWTCAIYGARTDSGSAGRYGQP